MGKLSKGRAVNRAGKEALLFGMWQARRGVAFWMAGQVRYCGALVLLAVQGSPLTGLGLGLGLE